MDYKHFLICVLVYVSLVTAQEQDPCIQNEIQNLLACSMKLLKAMGMNTDATSSSETPQFDLSAMMNGLCSTEGRTAIECTIGVLGRCPPLKQMAQSSLAQIPSSSGSPDLSQIYESGQLDKVCAMLSGGVCAQGAMGKVMGCFQNILTSMGLAGGANGTSSNPLKSFSDTAVFLCSETGMNAVTCMKNAFNECPEIKKQIEEQQKQQGTPDIEEDLMKYSSWREKNCNTSEYATFENQRSCVDDATKAPEYETCGQTVGEPDEKGVFPCGTNEKMQICLDKSVGKKCSKDAAKVSLSLLKMLLKTPENCEPSGTSAVPSGASAVPRGASAIPSSASVVYVSMSTGLIAVAVLFAVL